MLLNLDLLPVSWKKNIYHARIRSKKSPKNNSQYKKPLPPRPISINGPVLFFGPSKRITSGGSLWGPPHGGHVEMAVEEVEDGSPGSPKVEDESPKVRAGSGC